jgi:hypothetical protein
MSERDFVDPAHSSAVVIRLWNGDRLETVNLSPESSRAVTIVSMTWFAGGLSASAAGLI